MVHLKELCKNISIIDRSFIDNEEVTRRIKKFLKTTDQSSLQPSLVESLKIIEGRIMDKVDESHNFII